MIAIRVMLMILVTLACLALLGPLGFVPAGGYIAYVATAMRKEADNATA